MKGHRATRWFLPFRWSTDVKEGPGDPARAEVPVVVPGAGRVVRAAVGVTGDLARPQVEGQVNVPTPMRVEVPDDVPLRQPRDDGRGGRSAAHPPAADVHLRGVPRQPRGQLLRADDAVKPPADQRTGDRKAAGQGADAAGDEMGAVLELTPGDPTAGRAEGVLFRPGVDESGPRL